MATTKRAEIEAILAKPYAVELVYGETPDEGVLAQVTEWPGCMTAGETREEALSHIEDAMWDWAEARLQAGLDIPEPMAAYSGKVLLRIPRDIHRAAERRARDEGTSLNTWLTTAIARELGPAEGARRSSSARAAVGGPRKAARRRPARRSSQPKRG